MRQTLLVLALILLPISAQASEPTNSVESWQAGFMSILDDIRAFVHAAHGWIDPVGQTGPQPDTDQPGPGTIIAPAHGWIDPVGSANDGDGDEPHNGPSAPEPSPVLPGDALN